MAEVIRSSSRRSDAMIGIPKTVAIPKFFSPTDIRRVLEIKDRLPHMTWDRVVKHVVTEGVRK